jgi:chromosome segregation ATPase
MSKYEKLTRQITALDEEIGEVTRTIAMTQSRVDGAEDSLCELWDSLKSVMLSGEEGSIRGVEKTIAEARTAQTRDKALLEGMKEKLPVLEEKREGLMDERNQLIAHSASKWFDGEIATFEKQRAALLLTTRRLLAASTLLHSTGDGGRETARAHLGEAWGRLRVLKVPSIRSFDQSIYLDERRQQDLIVSAQERQAVLDEIAG